MQEDVASAIRMSNHENSGKEAGARDSSGGDMTLPELTETIIRPDIYMDVVLWICVYVSCVCAAACCAQCSCATNVYDCRSSQRP